MEAKTVEDFARHAGKRLYEAGGVEVIVATLACCDTEPEVSRMQEKTALRS